jgi:hypothetical protein
MNISVEAPVLYLPHDSSRGHPGQRAEVNFEKFVVGKRLKGTTTIEISFTRIRFRPF